jgi:hypothetical protein
MKGAKLFQKSSGKDQKNLYKRWLLWYPSSWKRFSGKLLETLFLSGVHLMKKGIV